MRSTAIISLLPLAAAAPHVPSDVNDEIPEAVDHIDDPDVPVRRDVEAKFASECPEVIFIWARGTKEPGNMGDTGPIVARNLEDHFHGPVDKRSFVDPIIWIQGVTFDAAEEHLDKYNQSSREAIDEAKRMFSLAHTKCADAFIATAGYEQGASVLHHAIGELPQETRDRISSVSLLGYATPEGKVHDIHSDRVIVQNTHNYTFSEPERPRAFERSMPHMRKGLDHLHHFHGHWADHDVSKRAKKKVKEDVLSQYWHKFGPLAGLFLIVVVFVCFVTGGPHGAAQALGLEDGGGMEKRADGECRACPTLDGRVYIDEKGFLHPHGY